MKTPSATYDPAAGKRYGQLVSGGTDVKAVATSPRAGLSNIQVQPTTTKGYLATAPKKPSFVPSMAAGDILAKMRSGKM
jgi:hypothetical protein